MCDQVPCRCSCDAQLVTTLEQLLEEHPHFWNHPGRFYFNACHEGDLVYQQLWLVLPNGHASALPVLRPGEQRPAALTRPTWQWDGNLIKPTLTPSIRSFGGKDREFWHGYLTRGRLVSC